MADLHHLQDHFSNFLLNFSSLAKNAKREILRQKGDLRCKICNCIKCPALLISKANVTQAYVMYIICLLKQAANT